MHAWIVREWQGRVTSRAPTEHDALGWFRLDEIESLDLALSEAAVLVADAFEQL